MIRRSRCVAAVGGNTADNTAEKDIMRGIGYLTEENKKKLADILARRGDKFVDFLNSYGMLYGEDLSVINLFADLLANANRKYSSTSNHRYSDNMQCTLQAIAGLLANVSEENCEMLYYLIIDGFWNNNDFFAVERKVNPHY